MSHRTEQRICLRFCFRLGKTATEAHEMLQKAFKEEALSRTQVFEWYARFKRGETSVEDHPNSGRPVNTSYRRECRKNSRKKFQWGSSVHNWRDLKKLHVWVGSSCQRILTVDLNMRRVAAKFVPRLLTQDQKNTRMALCQELKIQIESDRNFLSKVITGDENWCYGYDLETKQASSQWKTPTSPRPKKSKTSEVKCEKNAHCFFRCSRNHATGIRSSWIDCQSGILLGGFEAIERECAKKTPRIVEIGWMVSPLWQHPSSHSFVCDPVFGLSGMDRHSPPPYSPDLALCGFFLFPTMKKTWKGKRFPTVEEMKTAPQEALNNIKLQQFQICFTQWEKRLDKCIASNGEYFEGD